MLDRVVGKFENTSGVIRNCKSKDRQHNGQMEKDERTNNGTQSATQKTGGSTCRCIDILEVVRVGVLICLK
jgi:hypothetical protein